jgi:YVTN family beta-propeller protein
VAVAPNGGYACVSDGGANDVRVISTATNTQVATVAVGSLPYSVAVSGNEEPAGTPSAPAAPDLSAAAASGQVALTWTSQPGATGYSLYQGGTEVYSGTATTYTDTGLTNGTSYDFTVTATGPGGTSSRSDTASATPEAVPAAPALSASVNNNQQATLSWTAPTTQAPQQPVSYSVYVNGAPEAAGLATTSAILTGLTNGRAYSVRVGATDGYGQASPESAVANVMASALAR